MHKPRLRAIGTLAVGVVAASLATALAASQCLGGDPVGVPMGEPRMVDVRPDGSQKDLGTVADWERAHRRAPDDGASSDSAGGAPVAPPAPPASAAPPVVSPQQQAEDALAAGDLDKAGSVLAEALKKAPGDAGLIAKLNEVRRKQLQRAVDAANSSRRVELAKVLDKAKKSLPDIMGQPSPRLALSEILGETLSDPAVVDLRDARTLVVDPVFFRDAPARGSATSPAKRFVDPPEPGKPLAPLAFAGSPYAAVFETPEFTNVVLAGLQPSAGVAAGDLHKAREALLQSAGEALVKQVDRLPARPLRVLTTSDAAELKESSAKVKAALADYVARRRRLLGAAGVRCLTEMRTMLDGMQNEGWWNPGADLVKATESDPILKAEMDNRTRAVRWYGELYLDEAEDQAYRELAARVARIMKEGSPR